MLQYFLVCVCDIYRVPTLMIFQMSQSHNSFYCFKMTKSFSHISNQVFWRFPEEFHKLYCCTQTQFTKQRHPRRSTTTQQNPITKSTSHQSINDKKNRNHQLHSQAPSPPAIIQSIQPLFLPSSLLSFCRRSSKSYIIYESTGYKLISTSLLPRRRDFYDAVIKPLVKRFCRATLRLLPPR